MAKRGRRRKVNPRRRYLTPVALSGAATIFCVGAVHASTPAAPIELAFAPINATALAQDAAAQPDFRSVEKSFELRTEKESVPFTTKVQQDPKLAQGTKIVTQPGTTGKVKVTYEVRIVDGVEVQKQLVSRSVTRMPLEQVEIHGTGDPNDIEIALASAEKEVGTPETNKAYAKLYIKQEYNWGDGQFSCLEKLWKRESNWRQAAHNKSSGAHGIPQALPGRKMASFGDDWRTNPATQIQWGANYIAKRYDTPCSALDHSYDRGWY
jgi:hypothetical protein